MTMSRTEAIGKAEKVLEAIKTDYPPHMLRTIAEMDNAFETRNYDQLTFLSHELKGEAGTFGWPLISQAAGWLRQLLENRGAELDDEIYKIFLDSLHQLSAPDLAGENEAGVCLIKQLYALCESQEIRPS